MIVTIVPATVEHAIAIAADVRAPDAAEIWASTMQVPELALRSGLRFSDQAMTGLIDGEPVCMWGVVTESMIGRIGVPWMLGTSKLDKLARVFLRHCREPLLEMMQGYGKLINYVDARNLRTIKWLRFMGFHVEPETQPYGVSGLPFHRFTMGGQGNV